MVGRGAIVVDVVEVGVDIGAAVEAPDHLGGAAPRSEADRHPGEAGEPGGGPGGEVEEAGGDAPTAAARDLGEERVGLGAERAEDGDAKDVKRHARRELLDVEVVILPARVGDEARVDAVPRPGGPARPVEV